MAVEKRTVQLIYFKHHGKYYTECNVEIECEPYDVPQTVARMLVEGNWPGLCDSPWHHFDVAIVTCPENHNLPADHPNYIVPCFIRNEHISETAYR